MYPFEIRTSGLNMIQLSKEKRQLDALSDRIKKSVDAQLGWDRVLSPLYGPDVHQNGWSFNSND